MSIFDFEHEAIAKALRSALQRVGDDLLSDALMMRPFDDHYGPEDAAAFRRMRNSIRSLPESKLSA